MVLNVDGSLGRIDKAGQYLLMLFGIVLCDVMKK